MSSKQRNIKVFDCEFANKCFLFFKENYSKTAGLSEPNGIKNFLWWKENSMKESISNGICKFIE